MSHNYQDHRTNYLFQFSIQDQCSRIETTWVHGIRSKLGNKATHPSWRNTCGCCEDLCRYTWWFSTDLGTWARRLSSQEITASTLKLPSPIGRTGISYSNKSIGHSNAIDNQTKLISYTSLSVSEINNTNLSQFTSLTRSRIWRQQVTYERRKAM